MPCGTVKALELAGSDHLGSVSKKVQDPLTELSTQSKFFEVGQ